MIVSILVCEHASSPNMHCLVFLPYRYLRHMYVCEPGIPQAYVHVCEPGIPQAYVCKPGIPQTYVCMYVNQAYPRRMYVCKPGIPQAYMYVNQEYLRHICM